MAWVAPRALAKRATADLATALLVCVYCLEAPEPWLGRLAG